VIRVLASRLHCGRNCDFRFGCHEENRSFRYDRYITPRTFTFGLTILEHDGQQQLRLRTNAGGGFGIKLINSDSTNLSLLGGLTFGDERYMPEASTAYGAKGEGLLSLSLEQAQIKNIHL